MRLVARTRTPGAPASSAPTAGAASSTCSKLSSTSSSAAVAQLRHELGLGVEAGGVGDGGRHRGRIAQRREVDEVRAVGEVVQQRLGRAERQPGLARPAGAGERDQPGVRRAAARRAPRSPARARRAASAARAGCAARRRGRVGERRVLAQDRRLQLAQRGARLEPELLDQQLAPGAVDVERLGLAAGAVEREHQQAARALAQRLGGHQLLQVGQRLRVAAALAGAGRRAARARRAAAPAGARSPSAASPRRRGRPAPGRATAPAPRRAAPRPARRRRAPRTARVGRRARSHSSRPGRR